MFVAESVTVIVNVNDPAAAGVPEITPVDDNVSPVGNAPVVTANVYGVTPPVATRLVV